MDINAERQKRTGLARQARGILDAAEKDGGRDLTADETETFDRLMADVDKADARIEREESLRQKERRTDEETAAPEERNGPDGSSDGAEVDKAFRQYLIAGRASMTPEQLRALSVGSDPEGGYLVAPQKFVEALIQRIDDDVPLRGLADVVQLADAESLGVPTLDTDLNDADWTSEIGTGSQDDALRFGKRELHPNPLAKRVKVSRKLLRLASGKLDAETIVRARMAYKFGVSQEKAFMVGDGNKKPLGLFTASTSGISTARDVAVGAAGAIPLTTATGDQLIDAKYTLKAGYWPRSRWLFHRDLIRTIRKIKTTDGFYVWQGGLQPGQPDTILDVPFVVSEFAPNTIAGNQYVGMIADFKFYMIADALDMEIQRLVELYAETNQVGFIGRLETDGMPVLEEAFVRLKVAP